ncbi:hypothetical protein BDW22DRAFT_1350733 [Trametopsis cervina]|nr:hypothetical protein BDW22DRAFT_1350733 [Trametopsis cervina]
MRSYDENELPTGWVREYDQQHNHPYWVDTKAKPPRAIWTHPYEDEQFLNEHPSIRARLSNGNGAGSSANAGPSDAPPPYEPGEGPRRHSFHGKDKSSSDDIRPAQMPRPPPGPSRASSNAAHKRGFFGKIKDKAIGTKEEREEARRQEALLMQRRAEERKREIEEYRRQREEWLRQQQQAGPSRRYQQPTVYAAPYGSPYGSAGYGGYGGGGFGGGYGYGGGFGPSYGYGGRSGYGSRSTGAGDLALPLLGGLAGGLLLGDLLGGF